jgi:predicted metal-binding membrane protein
VLGMGVFAVGAAIAVLELRLPTLARAVPMAVGVIVLIAGALQFTAWKARQLACCRAAEMCGRVNPADVGVAWRHGLRLGVRCGCCCAGLTAALLVVGVMNICAMSVVMTAICVERLVPRGAERAAQAIGAIVVGAGIFLIARAAGWGE